MPYRTLSAALAALALLGSAPGAAEAQTPPAYVTSDAVVAAGEVTLSARLYAPPERERYPVVVLVSGSGNESVIDGVYTQILAGAFAARGIGVLAYDKRGTGRSSGDFTGSDFESLGGDAAAVVRYAQGLPQADRVGLWGISQAGWIAPYAVRQSRDLAFAILVSPGGVNPFEQVAYFLRTQALSWGLTPEEVDAADRMHRAVSLYYSGRASYRSAQAEVDRHRDARWFRGVITHPYWDEMTPEGRILDPQQLAAALRERPGAFEIYSSPSTYVNYARDYRVLRRLPTLIIYGGADELVPPALSQPLFERALRGERRHAHEFRVFEGASHDITTPEGRVLPEYLDAMTGWAAAQFDAQR